MNDESGMEGPPADDICSVCLDNFHTPCKSNCSHWFCGTCITAVWRHRSLLRPCECPLCRRPITRLSVLPAKGSSSTTNPKEVARILLQIKIYNTLFGKRQACLDQMVPHLPLLLGLSGLLVHELLHPRRSLLHSLRDAMMVKACLDLSSDVFQLIANPRN